MTRRRIVWTEGEKLAVLDALRELMPKNPGLSKTALLDLAQSKAGIEKARRRKIGTRKGSPELWEFVSNPSNYLPPEAPKVPPENVHYTDVEDVPVQGAPFSAENPIQSGDILQLAIEDIANTIAKAIADNLRDALSDAMSDIHVHLSPPQEARASKPEPGLSGIREQVQKMREEKKQSILIIGLFPNQREAIRQEFAEEFDIEFWQGATPGTNRKALTPKLQKPDVIIGVTTGMRHADQDHVKKAGVMHKFIRVNSTRELRTTLEGLYLREVV